MTESAPETVVAVLPTAPVKTADTKEVALSKAISAIEMEAGLIVVDSDDDYKAAAEFGRKVKSQLNSVKEWFGPLKESAHQAHKAICARENDMLDPLKKAERIIKNSMGEYAQKKERERQAAEAELRRQAKEEADRALAEAMAAESNGDTEAAESALADAEMADSISQTAYIPTAAPKAAGISQRDDWEIVSIDSATVPISHNNIELRPVDKAAVIKLIRFTKGEVKIPGVVYRKIIQTSIRS
jgi:hypothetical protein